MNVIFVLLLLSSCIILIFVSPNSVFECMLNGASNGLKLTITLLSIYVICMAILDIIEKSKLSLGIGKLTRPLTHRLFPNEDSKTHDLISMNFAMNLLGMGQAATPLGINAISRMNKDKQYLTNNSILFIVINATSIQLLPTTIIGIRSSYGASDPANIILPTLISTSIATMVGIILCKVLSHKK